MLKFNIVEWLQMNTSNDVVTFPFFFVADRKCDIMFHSSENSSSPMFFSMFVQINGKLWSASHRR